MDSEYSLATPEPRRSARLQKWRDEDENDYSPEVLQEAYDMHKKSTKPWWRAELAGPQMEQMYLKEHRLVARLEMRRGVVLMLIFYVVLSVPDVIAVYPLAGMVIVGVRAVGCIACVIAAIIVFRPRPQRFFRAIVGLLWPVLYFGSVVSRLHTGEWLTMSWVTCMVCIGTHILTPFSPESSLAASLNILLIQTVCLAVYNALPVPVAVGVSVFTLIVTLQMTFLLHALQSISRHRFEKGILNRLQAAKMDRMRMRMEKLLTSVLPPPITKRMRHGEHPIFDRLDDVTVMFCELEFPDGEPSEGLLDLFQAVYSHFDAMAARRNCIRIKIIDRVYMVSSGVPSWRPDSSTSILQLALEFQDFLRDFCAHDTTVKVIARAGVCSGPVVAGVIGHLKFCYDVWGDTVNTASRMMYCAEEGHVQVTASVAATNAFAFLFEDLPSVNIKGKGFMSRYKLVGPIQMPRLSPRQLPRLDLSALLPRGDTSTMSSNRGHLAARGERHNDFASLDESDYSDDGCLALPNAPSSARSASWNLQDLDVSRSVGNSSDFSDFGVVPLEDAGVQMKVATKSQRSQRSQRSSRRYLMESASMSRIFAFSKDAGKVRTARSTRRGLDPGQALSSMLGIPAHETDLYAQVEKEMAYTSHCGWRRFRGDNTEARYQTYWWMMHTTHPAHMFLLPFYMLLAGGIDVIVFWSSSAMGEHFAMHNISKAPSALYLGALPLVGVRCVGLLAQLALACVHIRLAFREGPSTAIVWAQLCILGASEGMATLFMAPTSLLLHTLRCILSLAVTLMVPALAPRQRVVAMFAFWIVYSSVGMLVDASQTLAARSALYTLVGVLAAASYVHGEDQALREQFKVMRLLVKSKDEIQERQERNDRLLRNMYPAPVFASVKEGIAPAPSATTGGVLFTDIVGFTAWASSVTPAEVVQVLNALFVEFDSICARYGLEKVKTIGDAYVCVSGMIKKDMKHLSKLAQAALDMVQIVADQKTPHKLQMRVGLHCGHVVAGCIGATNIAWDVFGPTVRTANFLESKSMPNRILVSHDVCTALDEHFLFSENTTVQTEDGQEMITHFLTGAKANVSPRELEDDDRVPLCTL